MSDPPFHDVIGPALAGALDAKGFTSLTQVQEAVLAPELAGRDLRISSQTGSGKTVAIGLALRQLAELGSKAEKGVAKPRIVVVTPTRELAKQVEAELTWLYAPLKARVASASGGASYRDELRSYAAGPTVVVGTPGRLVDHLKRGVIATDQIGAVVLDEADHMLDMGFREELDAILAALPEERRTHLVSATFPREVRALADRVQKDPARVEGTQLGVANADIDHVVHIVDPRERFAAIVNLLLAAPDARTLVFARTRADVGELTSELRQAGFAADALSGEMEQRERTRALDAFKRGQLDVLVATDVAARGIDVQDIARVIHTEPPTDADTYTHRSGRTGRAGKKGVSAMLVSPSRLVFATRLLGRARVPHRFEPIPTAEQLRDQSDERLFQQLTAADPDGFAGYDDRLWALAKRIAKSAEPTKTIARFLVGMRASGKAEPREIHPVQPPGHARGPRPLRDGRDAYDGRAPRDARDAGEVGARGEARGEARSEGASGPWVRFHCTWGGLRGADTRRLLAMACRRGGIQGSDVGAIRVERNFSTFDVAATVADRFAEAVSQPDPRDARVVIRRDGERAAPARGPAWKGAHARGGPSGPRARASDDASGKNTGKPEGPLRRKPRTEDSGR